MHDNLLHGIQENRKRNHSVSNHHSTLLVYNFYQCDIYLLVMNIFIFVQLIVRLILYDGTLHHDGNRYIVLASPEWQHWMHFAQGFGFTVLYLFFRDYSIHFDNHCDAHACCEHNTQKIWYYIISNAFCGVGIGYPLYNLIKRFITELETFSDSSYFSTLSDYFIGMICCLFITFVVCFTVDILIPNCKNKSINTNTIKKPNPNTKKHQNHNTKTKNQKNNNNGTKCSTNVNHLNTNHSKNANVGIHHEMTLANTKNTLSSVSTTMTGNTHFNCNGYGIDRSDGYDDFTADIQTKMHRNRSQDCANYRRGAANLDTDHTKPSGIKYKDLNNNSASDSNSPLTKFKSIELVGQSQEFGLKMDNHDNDHHCTVQVVIGNESVATECDDRIKKNVSGEGEGIVMDGEYDVFNGMVKWRLGVVVLIHGVLMILAISTFAVTYVIGQKYNE